MERLKILDASGKTLLERPLEDVESPALVVADGDSVRLVPSVATGDRVLAALVLETDGWVIAAADRASPVVCGTKCAGSLPLLVDSACSVAGFAFCLESDAVRSGHVLVWRVGKSAVAAESVTGGRNVVAADALRDESLTVNPAVSGTILFEFYPTGDGLDVVLPSGIRTRIAERLVFSVGDFTGLLLPSDEAAAALRSRHPFSYPSRGVRVRLLAASLGVGLLTLLGAFFMREAERTERLADEPRGARRMTHLPASDSAAFDEDAYIYQLSFYRDLPLVLGAQRSPVADDLLARAAHFKGNASVQRAARFLADVTAIQDSIAARRWAELAKVLGGIDREMFTIANATRFLEDAQDVHSSAARLIPETALQACTASPAAREELNRRASRILSEMSKNLFVQSGSLKGWFQGLREQKRALIGYLSARDRLCAPGRTLTVADIASVRAAFAALEQVGNDDLPGVTAHLRKELAAEVARMLATLTSRFRTVTDFAPEMAAILPLCELADDVGVAAERVRAWRQEALRINRLVDARFRDCYRTYRLTVASDPAGARRLLDEMLAIGHEGSRFHAWARREKERLAATEGKEARK